LAFGELTAVVLINSSGLMLDDDSELKGPKVLQAAAKQAITH
jgi:hypothetical protein